MKKLILRSLTLVLFGTLVAKATAMAFGTKWVIKNDSNLALTVSCELEALDASRPLRMEVSELSAHSSLDYKWGSLTLTDGLRLNGGKSLCQAKTGDGQIVSSSEFTIDKGENVVLQVSSEAAGIRLAKVGDNAEIARRNQVPSATLRN